MNLKTDFTEPECEWFRRNCNFTDQERIIFDLRVRDKTIIAIQDELQAMGLPLSEATINRRIRSIKDKILKVS